MDIERTRQYYANLGEKDLCQCAYCRNYANGIKAALPALTAYLNHLGVDIEKPFEVLPLDESTDYMEYLGVQYVVIGNAKDFEKTTVGDMEVIKTDSHPATGICEEHFVIEIIPDHPIRLKRVL